VCGDGGAGEITDSNKPENSFSHAETGGVAIPRRESASIIRVNGVRCHGERRLRQKPPGKPVPHLVPPFAFISVLQPSNIFAAPATYRFSVLRSSLLQTMPVLDMICRSHFNPQEQR
jgi:hypothetical protein